MRETIIILTGIVTTTILLCIVAHFIFIKVDTINWNNGVCTECNTGHYNFVNASDKFYYYQCDNCGHIGTFYYSQQ